MSDWDLGYISEVSYTSHFYRELTPNILDFVRQVRGEKIAAPVATYCELGCGHGFSANLLAAANPHIQFYANDFNPSQIVGARSLAADANLSNVNFYDTAFADFIDQPGLPDQFDVIALHGIYSWINKENRLAILDFISKKLKVGGLVYISYNCLPGWAAAAPMRQFLFNHAESSNAPILDKLDAALEFADRVLPHSKYFTGTDNVKERLGKLREQNKNYVVHEYFNKDWTPFYFSEIAKDMDQAKLTFIGSGHLLNHIDAVNLTKTQAEILASEPSSVRREVLRDFLLNQQFRKDVYIKGNNPHSFLTAQQIWLNSRFALSTLRKDVPMKVSGSLGEAELQKDVYEPVLDAFGDGPVMLKDVLEKHKAVADLGWQRLTQAIIVLVGGGILSPCLPEEGENKRKESTRAFNRAVMERAKTSTDLTVLASPVTGGGVAAGRFDQLFLLAHQNGVNTPEDCAKQTWRILVSQGQKLIKKGKTLETEEENITDLLEQQAEFEKKRLPVWKLLGIA